MSNIVNLALKAPVCATGADKEALADELLQDICYQLAIRPLPFMRAELLRMLSNLRCEPDMLLMALDDTLKAQRPSWAYFRAIVGKCSSEGVTTAEGYTKRTYEYYRKLDRY